MNLKHYFFTGLAFFISQTNAMEPEKLDIFDACDKGDLPRVRELITSGIPVDSICTVCTDRAFHALRNTTPLLVAVASGKYLVTLDLISLGANIHQKCKTEGGQSINALAIAVIGNRTLITQMLLQAGADINQPLDKNIRCLTYAISANQPTMCRVLIGYGADLFENRAGNWKTFDLTTIHNTPDCLKEIICTSFFLPPQELSVLNEYTSAARNALARLPFCSDVKSTTPGQKVRTLIFCCNQRKLPRDIRELLLGKAMPKELVALLSKQFSQKKKIPLFALELMTDACYKETAKRLLPELEMACKRVPLILARKNNGDAKFQTADPSIAPLLDPVNFEANYGEQLRVNIKRRLANHYVFMSELVPSENKKTTE